MAARPGVATLQLDKSDGAYFFWIALMKRFVSAEYIFDASTTTVVLWTFEDYSLADHQFIQLKINSQESPQTGLTVLIPRKFVMAFVRAGELNLGPTQLQDLGAKWAQNPTPESENQGQGSE